MEAPFHKIYSRSSTYSNINGKEKRFDVMHYKDPKNQKDAYYAGLRDPELNKFEEELGKSKNESDFSVLKRRDGKKVGLLRRPFEEMKRWHNEFMKKYTVPQKQIQMFHEKPQLKITSQEKKMFDEFLNQKKNRQVARKQKLESYLAKHNPFEESFFEETQF
jgi:hypothetical protein